jgi:hypothetical protein
MISKSEWNSVNDERTEPARSDAGEPPTYEEVLAYSRGELPPAEEERVRELLVSYPELARTMFASIPEDEAKPGEPGYVSDEELASRLAALQERLPRESQPVLPYRQTGRVATRRWAPIALAAMLVIVSGLYLQSAMEARRLTVLVNAPHVAADERVILSDARRGGVPEGVQLNPEAGSYALVVSADDPMYRSYRLEVIEYETQRALWKSETLHRTEDNGTFSIFFRREFLQPGDYQVVVFGVAAGREERLATHTFSLPSASR